MNLLEKAVILPTGVRRPIEPGPYTTCTPTGLNAPGPHGAYRTEYQTVLAYEVRFYANSAEYEGALRRAQRVLLHGLYSPALAYIDRALHDISNGDYENAMKRLCELRDELVK